MAAHSYHNDRDAYTHQNNVASLGRTSTGGLSLVGAHQSPMAMVLPKRRIRSESIGSTKSVENNGLLNEIGKMKETLEEEKVSGYAYILRQDNAANLLTKQKVENKDFYGLFVHGVFEKASRRKVVTW